MGTVYDELDAAIDHAARRRPPRPLRRRPRRRRRHHPTPHVTVGRRPGQADLGLGPPPPVGHRRVPFAGRPAGPRRLDRPQHRRRRGAPGPGVAHDAPHRRRVGRTVPCRPIMSTCWPTSTAGRGTVVFADHEETLVAQCTLLRFSDACRMVAYWRQRADAATIEDEGQRLHDGRTASAATTHRRDRRPARRCSTRSVAPSSSPNCNASNTSSTSPICNPTPRPARPGSAASTPWSRWPAAPAPPQPGGLRPRPLLTVLVGETYVRSPVRAGRRHRHRPRADRPAARRTPTSNGSCSTAPTGSSPCPTSVASPAPCAERSKCVTGDVNIPPAATNRPPPATSTTSTPTAKAAPPRRTTAASNAAPTTATPTNTTPNPNQPTRRPNRNPKPERPPEPEPDEP